MFEFEKIKIYHYMAWKNRGLFLQKIEVFFLKKIEVFFFANRPLQGFNPLTKVYWKIRVCIENYNISRSGYLPRFHQIILRLPQKVTLQDHQRLRLPRKVTLRHHQRLRLPRKVTLRHHQILRLPRKVTLRHHQILRLPRKVILLLNCYCIELLLSCYWSVTKLLLICY